MKILSNTIKSLIEAALKSGISKIDAYYLMSYLLKRTKEEIFANIDDRISLVKLLRWKHIIRKRQKGVPANYITGSKEFYSLNFKVNSSVLIPRPETELIVEEVLKLKPLSLLDVGTGSGNIAISVKYHLPDCRVTAVDVKRSILRIAKENCKIILGDLRIRFIISDFCNSISDKFDIIASNPPYIPNNTIEKLQREVSKYEPKIALSGGDDGLSSYKKIFSECKSCLKKNGRLILEISDEVLNGVMNLACFNGWALEKLIKDYSGFPRVAIFKLEG